MPLYTSKRAIEQMAKLATVAHDESGRYQIDCVSFETRPGGLIGVATNGCLMVAKILSGEDAPIVPESTGKAFPNWRGVLPPMDDQTILIRLNPVLLIRALEAVMSMQAESDCEECGEVVKSPNAVVLSIPSDGKSPIGICCEDGKSIASLMRMNPGVESPRETMRATVEAFRESAKK